MTRYCAWSFKTEQEQINAYEDFVFKMGTGKIKVYGSVYRLMLFLPKEDDFTYMVALVVDDRDSHRKVKKMKPSGSTSIELDEDIISILSNNREKNAPKDENTMTRITHFA